LYLCVNIRDFVRFNTFALAKVGRVGDNSCVDSEQPADGT